MSERQVRKGRGGKKHVGRGGTWAVSLYDSHLVDIFSGRPFVYIPCQPSHCPDKFLLGGARTLLTRDCTGAICTL